jgi:hypothetical protein
MKPFLTLLIIFILIGLMDRVKFRYSWMLISKITKPAFLVRWLHPSQRLFTKGKWWFMMLLNGPLIGLNDFWHFLKFVMIEAIIYLGWLIHMEGTWWAFFLICNLGYGVVFEVIFTSDWIKDKKD